MIALIIFLGILLFACLVGFTIFGIYLVRDKDDTFDFVFGIVVILLGLGGIIGMGCYTKYVVSEHHIVMRDNANNIVKDSYYRGYEYITNHGCIKFKDDDNVYCGYIIDRTLVKEK